MWPGFDSRTRRHMWVEFVVGSRPCSERFFSGYSGFPLSSKTNISKFRFDLESEGHKFISLGLLCATLVKQSYLFIYLFNVLEFPFKDILTHVNLAISDAAETLLIPVEEHNEVKKSVAKMFEQRRPSRTALTASESPSSTAHQGYASSDDGRVVVEVQPEEQTEGGPRRSTRKRNAIVYDS